MAVFFQHEGYTCGSTLFRKRVFIEHMQTRRRVYPSSDLIARFGLLTSMISTDYFNEERAFLHHYVTGRFIGAAFDPQGIAAHMFLETDAQQHLDYATMAFRGEGSDMFRS